MKVEFFNGSYHFHPGKAPWVSDTPCSFHNTSKCLKSDCKYNHFPDERSLRLVVDGPNICKAHFIGENGCEWSKKGRKCYYSHDLTKAALPLHDKEALKEHLVMAEAWFNQIGTCLDLAAAIELEESWKRGAINKSKFLEKSGLLLVEREYALFRWDCGRTEAAKKELEQLKNPETIIDVSDQSEVTAVLDVSGLSGADILRQCGVENPFSRQRERKLIAKTRGLLASEVCDKADGWETEDEWVSQAGQVIQSGEQKKRRAKESERSRHNAFNGFERFNPYNEDNMYDLLCQGVKPWDDDAGDVLMMLNGGF